MFSIPPLLKDLEDYVSYLFNTFLTLYLRQEDNVFGSICL